MSRGDRNEHAPCRSPAASVGCPGTDGFTKGWIGAQPPEWLKKVAKLRSTDRPCRTQQRSRIPPANQYLLRIPSHHRRFTKLLPTAGRSLYAPTSSAMHPNSPPQTLDTKSSFREATRLETPNKRSVGFSAATDYLEGCGQVPRERAAILFAEHGEKERSDEAS